MRMCRPYIVDKRRRESRKFLVLSALFSLLVAGCRPAGPQVALEGSNGKGVHVTVEIVSTPEAQRRGLMWRTELAADHGMLFVFDGDAERTFWMKNTPLPLDIIFINADREIVSIAENTVPYSLTQIPSAAPAMYVLEVNAGFSRKHGIAPGGPVSLPDLNDR